MIFGTMAQERIQWIFEYFFKHGQRDPNTPEAMYEQDFPYPD